MKRMIVALAALWIAGCASVSGLREKDPAFTGSSSKNVDAVSACISTAWQERHDTVRVVPIAGGQSIQADNAALAGSPLAVADVTGTDRGSATRYFHQSVGTGWFMERVRSCQ